MVINENNTHINSFTKGMNSDTAYDQIQNSQYTFAKNIRITKNQSLGGASDYSTLREGIVTPEPAGKLVSDEYQIDDSEGDIEILAVDSVDNIHILVCSDTSNNLIVYRVNLDDYHKKEFPNLHETLSPIFVDIYGESFLWNMVRKMMRVFVDVAKGKMTLDEVEKLLNPKENEPRAYIKVMEPYYLILMDIQYDGIKFRYDDYACERFKRNLVDSLTDLQKRYAIRESMIKSLNDLSE